MSSEAMVLIQRVAEPRPVGDKVKAAIGRASKRLGFPFNRARSIWYGEARRIDATEMDRLREIAGRRETAAAIEHLLVIRGRLAETDAHFNRPQIAALDDALRAMGAEVCPLALSED